MTEAPGPDVGSPEDAAGESGRLLQECERLRAELANLQHLQTARRECKERCHAFVEHTGEAVWLLELDEPLRPDLPPDDQVEHIWRHGRLAECNDAMARMHGFERGDQVAGARLDAVLDRADPRNAGRLRAFVRKGYRLTEDESREVDAEGNARWFTSTLLGVDEGRGIERAWGTRREVTAHRALEEDLRQAQRMEAIGRLASGIAHDFNNLLTAVVGHAEMAEEKLPARHDVRADLGEIRLAAQRAAGLTRQLLEFSRHQAVKPAALDFNDLLRRLEPMLRRLLRADVDLTLDLEEGLWAVRADAVQMEQVVVNLATNARETMPAGGSLRISTSNVTLSGDDTCGAVGEHVLVQVSDSGVGMEPDVQRRAFEPYFTSRELQRGTGLGLATCHGIVSQSGGRIEMNSRPDRGSTFRIWLPRFEGVPLAASRPAATTPMPTGSETILVVEDEPPVRALAVTVLRKLGYLVLEASSGAEALRVAAGHPGRIDLLLADVVMARMSGAELAEALVAARPGTAVLLTSGYPGAAVADAVATGGVDFLHKPYTLSELSRRVREALARSGEH